VKIPSSRPSEWLVNVSRNVAGKLAMLKILVVLARRQVRWRAATSSTAFQAIIVSTIVD
jgi:hypothetical protein